MDLNHAKLIFSITEEDDLNDVWEEHFFKHKQFFLTHSPIKKVWEARLEKMLKEYSAYCVLIGKLVQNEEYDKLPSEEEENYEGKSVLESFNVFFAGRNKFKMKTIQVNDPLELSNIIHLWLSFERNYYEQWFCEESINDEGVKVLLSKEPDPMELLKSLKEWERDVNKQVDFSTLCSDYSFLPELLKKEVKRLSSLYKNYA